MYISSSSSSSSSSSNINSRSNSIKIKKQKLKKIINLIYNLQFDVIFFKDLLFLAKENRMKIIKLINNICF